jgi:LuxR family maltose regulon positive regulatory protein
LGQTPAETEVERPPKAPPRAPWAATLGFDLLESKLAAPSTRPGIVARPALVERLATTEAPAVTVIGPPGYGKTTVLAERAASQPRLAWLALDHRDNDPAVLLAYLAAALDRIEPVSPSVLEAMAARRPVVTIATRLLAWVESIAEPFVLVIDHLDALTNPECLSVVTQLALGMPFEHHLVVASREAVSWPAPRMRAEGRLCEIGVADLALTPAEAVALLEAAGVDLESAEVAQLTARSEGWAAGLYLAALAIQAGSPRDRAVSTPRGDHPYLGDYLRAELLDHVPADEVTFLTRTSILDRVSGPLCDATLDTKDSADRLEEIARQNLLLVPLDTHAEWYRYHQLFRELLEAELHRREPELVAELHRRAAEWYEANGSEEDALAHAQAGRDIERVVRLTHELIQPAWASGRADTAMGWLQWVVNEDLMSSHPELAVHGALMYALLGHPIDAERWADAAERARVNELLSDGSTMESLLGYLRAFLGREGVEAMRADAVASFAGLSPTSPHRASMLFAEGVALVVAGDEGADATLAHAFDAAMAIEAVPLAALVLAERCGLAATHREWAAATALIEEALELVGDGRFDEYWTSALVFAWGARSALYTTDLPRARDLLARAARLRPLLTYALPVVSVQALVEMARAYIALADPSGAQAVLRQAQDILGQRPDLGGLGREVQALRSQLDVGAVAARGASSLTAAELRLLPYLATHLSLKEIGERVFLSRNTVKSQAISVYRKLGVSSRSEAIERLEALGLLVA